jgi:hypothetical protein
LSAGFAGRTVGARPSDPRNDRVELLDGGRESLHLAQQRLAAAAQVFENCPGF